MSSVVMPASSQTRTETVQAASASGPNSLRVARESRYSPIAVAIFDNSDLQDCLRNRSPRRSKTLAPSCRWVRASSQSQVWTE